MHFLDSIPRLIAAAACGCALAGCGSDGGGSNGDSSGTAGGSGGQGTAGASGSAGSAGSASGGAAGGGSGGAGTAGSAGAGAPERGSVALDFQATGDCSGQSLMIYAPENGGVPPVSASGATAFMTDDGYTVNHSSGVHCIVQQGQDGTFMFDGRISFDRPESFSVAMYCHSAALGGAPAVGGFTLVHPDLPVNYGTQAGQGAQFEFFELEPGRAFGKFTIPELPNFDDDTLCAVGESYFAFEDCELTY